LMKRELGSVEFHEANVPAENRNEGPEPLARPATSGSGSERR
jgi:hypothetical protein